MKNSNKLLLGLLCLLLSATVGIDLLLSAKYKKISLNDPYKNYEQVPMQPFKYLKIKGGNAYAIEIRQATKFDMKVMVSRKGFLHTTRYGDTLLIDFMLMNRPGAYNPDTAPKGLLIWAPALSHLTLDGTGTICRELKADSLQIDLKGNAIAVFDQLSAGQMRINAVENAAVEFRKSNRADTLQLHLNGRSSALLQDIQYSWLDPQLAGDSRLIFKAKTAAKLK